MQVLRCKPTLPRGLGPRCSGRAPVAVWPMAVISAAAAPVPAAGALRRSLLARHPLAVATAPRACRRQQRGQGPLRVSAMVNVDISPSVVLGVGLIGAGVSLWQIRRVKPWLSKDYDVVVSCISLLVGGILIFQGWRLDPLLLFGQLMTTGAAVSFAVEALRLRSEMYEGEEKAALQDVWRTKGGGPGSPGAGSSFQLPPPEPSLQQPWVDAMASGEQAWAEQQQQQQWTPAGSGPGQAWADQQQPQQPWEYGGSGYQVAEYEAYDGGLAGPGPAGRSTDPYASGGSSGTPGTIPTEFSFPASYSDAGSAGAGQAADGSNGWGPAYGEQQQQQQQQWGQPPPAQPGTPRRGTSFDGMDDW